MTPGADGDRQLPLRGRAIAALVTAILWLAATGKAIQVITEPMMVNRWFWTGVLEVELVLGLVVLLGHRSRWVWTGTGGFFIVLALFAGWKAVRGDADCGCFGVVTMNPWVTFTLDLVLAALLLGFRPPVRARGDWGSRERKGLSSVTVWAGAGGSVVLLIGVWIAIVVAASPPGTLRANGIIDGSSEHVVLEPEGWVGQAFPLVPYLPGDTDFADGAWDVVLARPGCPHCLDYLTQWESDTTHAAVISLASPAGDLVEAAITLGLKVYTLDEAHRWYAEVPIALRIEDGVVTHVSTSGSREKTTAPSRPTSSPSGGFLPPDLEDAEVFTGEGRIDLGYIVPGSEHSLVYRVQAPAGQALQILGIHSECKCTTVTQAPERVEAGEDALIVMRFVATDKPLTYNQGVLIRTDHTDPDLAQRRLVVTARIGLPLSVEPEHLSVSAAGEIPLSVTVTNDGPDPIRLIYAVAESPGVTAQVPRDPVVPGRSIEVPILIDHERWSGQPTRLRIPTTDENQPDLSISVEP